MRFLVDESTGPSIARWLKDLGHDAASVYDESPGIDDSHVIRRAFDEKRILITNDKDFGEKVFREQWEHHGIVLLRLADERASNKREILGRLLRLHFDRLQDTFVVVTENQVRFGR